MVGSKVLFQLNLIEKTLQSFKTDVLTPLEGEDERIKNVLIHLGEAINGLETINKDLQAEAKKSKENLVTEPESPEAA